MKISFCHRVISLDDSAFVSFFFFPLCQFHQRRTNKMMELWRKSCFFLSVSEAKSGTDEIGGVGFCHLGREREMIFLQISIAFSLTKNI